MKALLWILALMALPFAVILVICFWPIFLVLAVFLIPLRLGDVVYSKSDLEQQRLAYQSFVAEQPKESLRDYELRMRPKAWLDIHYPNR